MEPQSSCEEHETRIASSSQGEKVTAFVEDRLKAHEGLLQRQGEPVELADGQKLDRDQEEAEQRDEGVVIEEQGDCDGSKEMQRIWEEDQEREESPERSEIEAEESVGRATGLSDEGHAKDEPDRGINPPQGIHLERQPAESSHPTEEHRMGGHSEWKQPAPLPPTAPSDPDDDMVPTMTASGPGPLVTELEEAEPLETIHLKVQQPLCIDDLPDLEDVDTEDEDFTGFLSCKTGSRPKIQIISGDDDDDVDEGRRHQDKTTPGSMTSRALLFSECDHKPLFDASRKGLSMVAPEAEDATMPVIVKPLGGSNPDQKSTHAPRPLIEELD